MKTVALPSGEKVPAFGLGAWNIGDSAAARAEEIATLRLGLDLGAHAHRHRGDVRRRPLRGTGRRGDRRPARRGVPRQQGLAGQRVARRRRAAACERSLKRLRTDRIDLYLLHWRGSVPFAETVEAFVALQKAGKIRHFGVSNLDLSDMKEWWKVAGRAAPAPRTSCSTTSRGAASNGTCCPGCASASVPVMAYSPIEQARLLARPQARRVRAAPRRDARPGGARLAAARRTA